MIPPLFSVPRKNREASCVKRFTRYEIRFTSFTLDAIR